MARKQHLDLLRKGVEYWNRWRDSNPKVRPNLIGADLDSVNLSHANLTGALLIGADLEDAILEGAKLIDVDASGAYFINANLTNVKLIDSDMSGANFTNAILNNADLSGANLSGANLTRAKLERANLSRTNLSDAILIDANLEEAKLRSADLRDADLKGANLEDAILRNANLNGANLINSILIEADLRHADLSMTVINGADLSGADLTDVDLRQATIIRANLSGTILTNARLIETNIKESNLKGCRVYGISAWGVKLDEVTQLDLLITPKHEPTITVDNLEIAQFIYLLLKNENIRQVIDTITSKVVLILGRFIPERKVILDSLRDQLRRRNYLPVLFDFDKPASRDITETVSTLAHLARFVIADITDAKSIPQELERIVPNMPSLPIQPLLLSSEHEYGMFEHFKRYPWVLETFLYDSNEDLITRLDDKVISPVERKAKELNGTVITDRIPSRFEK
jgi:uncharacterized protein YjbI with pentapeptide repeats